MDNLLLDEEYLQILKNIFDIHASNCKVLAYGSRVLGDAHSGSDLDLTFIKKNGQEVYIAEVREALSESNIPFFVEITDYAKIPQSFRDEIQKKHVEIY